MNTSNKSILLLLAICIWICYQFITIFDHNANILSANPYIFAEKFNFIGISRTNLHSKTLQYWVDWFKQKTTQQVGHTTFTLLHFDYHPNLDITHDNIHPCSPAQLIYYHQLIEEALQSLDDLLYPINKNENGITNSINITKHVYQYGYIDTIIWIYPDHWLNYTQSFVHGLHYHRFRKRISNMTYYVTPIGNNQYKYTFYSNAMSNDEIEFFETKLSSSKTISHQLNDSYNSSTSIKLNIHAIALSELQQIMNIYEIFADSKVILDFDLDFFLCQAPSEILMNYFNWDNGEMTDVLNTYLSHHQYAPSHIQREDVNYAMLVLLHQLVHNQSDSRAHQTGLRSDDDFVDELDESPFNHKAQMNRDLPTIKDVIQHADANHLGPLELRDLLYHLYRFHLEIGNAEFVEPLSHYIQTHHHLDHYLFDISNNTSDIVDHHTLHQQIAHRLRINVYDSVYNLSVGQFGEINEMNHYPYYNEMKKWIQNHDSLKSDIDEYDINEEECITEILSKLRTNADIYKLTPNLLTDIIRNITQEQNYNLSHWLHIVSSSDSLANISIWDPGHMQFINSLQKQYGIERINTYMMTYPESLERLQLSGDYIYSDWGNILNFHSMNSNGSWIDKYIDEGNVTSYIMEELEDTELSTHNLSNIIPWNSLDPIQQHFLRKADHSLLEQFLSSLTKRQTKFLDWLIFCHLHGHPCEDGHTPIDLLDASNSDYLRLKGIDWEDINDLPAFIASEKHNDMLQFATTFHGIAHGNEIEDEVQHPTVGIIQNNINTIIDILQHSKPSIMTVGIEMSYAHIPKTIHQWLDCALSISLHNLLQTTTQFVSFYVAEGDEKALHYNCIEELMTKAL